MPQVTVLMAAYNAQNDIRTAVDSILNQTFGDFEFIIINDGSSDDTGKILDRYAQKDDRITIIHQDNQGLTKSLNTGLQKAEGQYIARQDADDVSHKDRLQKQVGYMDKHPDVTLCGSNCINLYEDGARDEWGTHNDNTLQKIVFFQTPFAHSSVMMRAQALKTVGGYDESFRTAQDMELWMRMAKNGKLAMLPEPLIERSVSQNSISAQKRWRQFCDAARARWMHNTALINKLKAQYTGLRCFLIESLPASFIHALKGLKS